ncbi:MAG: right-handed parallel beta-helix repeat-containing protein, partial [Planctomycetota bacterium]
MSWHRSFLIVAVVGLFVSATQAGTLYVDDDNCPGPGDGSELNPYCSIQTAIDNAVDTDEIVVAPGTYFEAINFLGKAITLRSSDGPEVTTIDGTGNLHVVQCVSGEGLDTVLEGFTVIGGNANGSQYPHYVGGGMYNENSSPAVTGCTFSDNMAFFGGGMYNHNSSPTV